MEFYWHIQFLNLLSRVILWLFFIKCFCIDPILFCFFQTFTRFSLRGFRSPFLYTWDTTFVVQSWASLSILHSASFFWFLEHFHSEQFFEDWYFFHEFYLSPNRWMSKFWGLWVLKLSIFFKEERKLENYFKGVFMRRIIVI